MRLKCNSQIGYNPSDTDMPENHLKLYQSVAADIVDRILSGEFATGTKLQSERDLANHYGVSRATIREASVALEIQGWVASKRGAGIFITQRWPDTKLVKDCDVGPFELLEARRVIEGEAAALATPLITKSELAELEEYIRQMGLVPDSPQGEKADGDFHILIAEVTRNSVIADTVERLWALRYQSPLCVEIFGRGRRAGVMQPVDDHKAILGALASGDPEKARAEMHAHLDSVVHCILAATENDDRAQIVRRRAFAHAKLKQAVGG